LIDPNDAKAYYNRGLAYKKLYLLNKTLVDFGKAIELDKDFALAYYNHGLVKIALDDIENACTDLSRAADLGVGNAHRLFIYYCRGLGS
jgi:tetratricopeptide (TPR) repeat protein